MSYFLSGYSYTLKPALIQPCLDSLRDSWGATARAWRQVVSRVHQGRHSSLMDLHRKEGGLWIPGGGARGRRPHGFDMVLGWCLWGHTLDFVFLGLSKPDVPQWHVYTDLPAGLHRGIINLSRIFIVFKCCCEYLKNKESSEAISFERRVPETESTTATAQQTMF